jgi:hypothetical protein
MSMRVGMTVTSSYRNVSGAWRQPAAAWWNMPISNWHMVPAIHVAVIARDEGKPILIPSPGDLGGMDMPSSHTHMRLISDRRNSISCRNPGKQPLMPRHCCGIGNMIVRRIPAARVKKQEASEAEDKGSDNATDRPHEYKASDRSDDRCDHACDFEGCRPATIAFFGLKAWIELR